MIQKPLTMRYKLAGGKDSVIPVGVTEQLTINIRDLTATFHFIDSKTTKRFALQTNSKGEFKAEYIERLQLAVIVYPNMNQKQIAEKIVSDIKELQGARPK